MKKWFWMIPAFAFAIVLSSCGTATQDAKIATVDTVKCAIKYPGDTVTQVSNLVEKLKNTSGFVNALVSWAESAKDSQFAACVFVTVVADIKKNHESNGSAVALMGEPDIAELSQAYEKFRASKFGDKQFEPASASASQK